MEQINNSYPGLSSTTIVERLEQRLNLIGYHQWKEFNRNQGTYTRFILGQFRRIGEGLGFEDNIRGESLGSGEYLRLDQVWFHHYNGVKIPIVVIEHENEYFNDIWEDELNKLLDVKSKIKILVYYDPKAWEDQLRKIEDRCRSYPIMDKDEEFIIMNGIRWEENLIFQISIIKQNRTESRTLKFNPEPYNV